MGGDSLYSGVLLMKIFRGTLFCGVLLLAQFAMSQTASSIRTGRPGQAIGPYVVGTGLLQIQSGLDNTSVKVAGSNRETSLVNNVVRQGINESFELSGVFNYEQSRNTTGAANQKSGVSDVQVGFRYNLTSQPDGWFPAIGLQTRVRLESVSSDFRRDEPAPVLLMALGHTLSDDFGLNTNLGMDYSGQTASPVYRYVFSLGHSIGETWGLAYEFYGNQALGSDFYYFGLGAYYATSSDFQWDLYISGGDNHGINELYVSAGLSWRVPLL